MPICVISPGYNNHGGFRSEKLLNSIFAQNYSNYRVVITDDASTDHTAEVIEKYLQFYGIKEDKAILVKNKERKYSGYTMYHAIMMHCDPTGITVSVDGDDELIGRQVFKVTNAVYQQKRIGVMWTRCMRLDINGGFVDYFAYSWRSGMQRVEKDP